MQNCVNNYRKLIIRILWFFCVASSINWKRNVGKTVHDKIISFVGAKNLRKFPLAIYWGNKSRKFHDEMIFPQFTMIREFISRRRCVSCDVKFSSTVEIANFLNYSKINFSSKTREREIENVTCEDESLMIREAKTSRALTVKIESFAESNDLQFSKWIPCSFSGNNEDDIQDFRLNHVQCRMPEFAASRKLNFSFSLILFRNEIRRKWALAFSVCSLVKRVKEKENGCLTAY